jgi:hypothetical protein
VVATGRGCDHDPDDPIGIGRLNLALGS